MNIKTNEYIIINRDMKSENVCRKERKKATLFLQQNVVFHSVIKLENKQKIRCKQK